MPTNDERREVAARLRECIGLHEFAEIFGFSWNDETDWYWRDVTAKVADYVEPEPERTCRMTKKGPEFVMAGWWECSECGPVYPPCNDEIAVWALQKCPHCGARVVE